MNKECVSTITAEIVVVTFHDATTAREARTWSPNENFSRLSLDSPVIMGCPGD